MSCSFVVLGKWDRFVLKCVYILLLTWCFATLESSLFFHIIKVDTQTVLDWLQIFPVWFHKCNSFCDDFSYLQRGNTTSGISVLNCFELKVVANDC